MKRLLRTFIFYLAALWITTQLLRPGIQVPDDLQIWAMSAAILAVLNMLLKPILTLLFLPIHALTLGLFSIVVNAGVFYLFLRLMPQISIAAWRFPGLTFQGVMIPAQDFPVLGTIFVASALISLITNFFAYLVE